MLDLVLVKLLLLLKSELSWLTHGAFGIGLAQKWERLLRVGANEKIGRYRPIKRLDIDR